MNKKFALILVVFLLLLLIVLSGCKKIYVCYDGTTRDKERECPTVPHPQISEKEAKSAVDKWGYAYASAKADRFTQVSTYADKSNWKSDILFTTTKTEKVHALTIEIDGKTATITCLTGCEYVGLSPEKT